MTSPIPQLAGFGWYREDDYPAILRIMADRHLLPASWQQWHERAQRGEAELRARGTPFIRVIIDPKEFSGWCAVRGLKLDAQGRMAFCNAEAYRHLQN